MALCDFTLPAVQERLGLRIEDVDLFSETPPLLVHDEFEAFLRDGTSLVNSTERAQGELNQGCGAT